MYHSKEVENDALYRGLLFNRCILEYRYLNPEGESQVWYDIHPLIKGIKEFQALSIKPDLHQAWNNRGNALQNLGRYEDAIASYDQALSIKPDKHDAWYNKACYYAFQGNIEQAIKNLQQAINLSPDECREMAKTDSDFDSIRGDERFQALIQG